MRRSGRGRRVALRGALAGSLLVIGAVGAFGVMGCGDAGNPGDADDSAPPSVSGDAKSRGRAAVAKSPAATPARSPLLADGDLGGYEPDAEAVARAAALADPATRDEAWAALFDLSDAERIALLRVGIRLRDPVAARTAASNLDWTELDPWEISRYVALRIDAALDPEFTLPDGRPLPFGDLYEAAGWEDVAAVLDRLAAWPAGRDPPDLTAFAAMHKSVRFEVLDALARHLRRPDAPGRDDAIEMLSQLAARTDRRRDDVAAALLGVSAAEARSRFPDDRDLVGAALATDIVRDWDDEGRFEGAWGGRWLRELGPTPAQLEAARAEREPDEMTKCLTYESATRALIREHPEEFRRSLLGGPVPGDDTYDPASPPDEEDLLGRIEILSDTLRTYIPWDPSVDATFRGFDAVAAGANLSARHLVAIAITVPGCRTRVLADAVLARLPTDRWPFLDYDPAAAEFDAALPFLETCAGDSFLHRLRRWSASTDPKSRDSALRALLELRDVPSAPVILRWAADLREGNHASVPWRALGELPDPSVRAFLVRHVESGEGSFPPSVRDAVEGIAAFDGLRCEAPWTERVPSGAMPEIARLVLAGHGPDALFAALASRDEPLYEGLATVRDPRTIPYLRRLRERRELGLYAHVTAELALAGDEEARAEVLGAIRSGRYGWLKSMTDRERSLGDPLAMVPLWLDALESNCCAEEPVLAWFQRTFGMSSMADEFGSTASAGVRAWFARHGDRFVESRLAGRLVPAPR